MNSKFATASRRCPHDLFQFSYKTAFCRNSTGKRKSTKKRCPTIAASCPETTPTNENTPPRIGSSAYLYCDGTTATTTTTANTTSTATTNTTVTTTSTTTTSTTATTTTTTSTTTATTTTATTTTTTTNTTSANTTVNTNTASIGSGIFSKHSKTPTRIETSPPRSEYVDSPTTPIHLRGCNLQDEMDNASSPSFQEMTNDYLQRGLL